MPPFRTVKHIIFICTAGNPEKATKQLMLSCNLALLGKKVIEDAPITLQIDKDTKKLINLSLTGRKYYL